MARGTVVKWKPPLLHECPPGEYLAKLKSTVFDTKKMIGAVMDLPYPADPLVEPELSGLTYYQVALIRQAQQATSRIDASLASLEFFTDRTIGRPAQVNVNISATESYEAFLDKIAKAEQESVVIDIPTENELGL